VGFTTGRKNEKITPTGWAKGWVEGKNLFHKTPIAGIKKTKKRKLGRKPWER